MVESIRGLRTALHFGMLESPNNRILVTGPSPGVGKSFVAANLAVTIARGGQHVLLVDTDLRKGRLHKIFGIKKAGAHRGPRAERWYWPRPSKAYLMSRTLMS